MRFALPVLCLALGAGATVGFTRYILPPTVVTVAEPAPPAPPVPPPAAPPADELVVEIRVRVPPGVGGEPVFPTDSSDIRPGALVNTGQALDLAVEGAGFFRVTLPGGEVAYTRVGNFGTGAEGTLVTAHGLVVTPRITIPTDAVSVAVGADGTVSVLRSGALTAGTTVGQLTLARFPNPGWLTPRGNGVFVESERGGIPTVAPPGQHGMGLVRQGFRERHPDRRAALIELLRELGREGRIAVRGGRE
jgi:flagellar basal-body rod protein FlgG